MDFEDNNGDHNEMWEWRREEDVLHTGPFDDVSHCFWGDANKDVDDFLNMLDEQTPARDCADLTYQVSQIGDKINEGLGESIDSSQVKTRRMLQFTSESNEVMECSTAEDELSEYLILDSQWNFNISDVQCTLNCEELDQSSERWLADCLNESEEHCDPGEMDVSLASFDHAYDTQCCVDLLEMEANLVQEKPTTPTCGKLQKGRKSCVSAPTKLTTSIAHPFVLIKPCGDQGNITLNDINQKIHAPPQYKLKHKRDEESMSYPASSFSGKPVVVKTKIRTEGGKGSITIMRTRG